MAEKRTRRKKVEEVNIEPLMDGDVIDTTEAVEEIKNDTVMVCSNFPRDIIFEVEDNNGKTREIHIKGNATNLRGKSAGILPIGAYGITANIPAEAWEKVLVKYRDDSRLKNGLIFASTPSKARKEAKERKDLRNGFEPIDPKKITTEPNKE